MRTILH